MHDLADAVRSAPRGMLPEWKCGVLAFYMTILCHKGFACRLHSAFGEL